jgi:hypothetical protein
MDSNDIGSGFLKCLGIALGLFDHQVHIAGFGSGLSEKIYQHGSKADVRHEASVHYIEVIPIGFAAVEHVTIFLQLQKVG